MCQKIKTIESSFQTAKGREWYVWETNNHENEKFNFELNGIAVGLRGKFQNTDNKVLDYTLHQADIRLDDIHPNQSGIQKMVFTIRNYNSSVGYKPAECIVSVSQIKKI